MSRSRTIWAWLVAATMLGYAHGQIGVCKKVDSCKCVYDDGMVVDLHPLERKDGIPNFGNVTGQDNMLYSWNPCMPFSYEANHSECINVAACAIKPGLPKELVYDLGDQGSAEFLGGNDSLTLQYTAKKDEFERVVIVVLRCTSSSKFHLFQAIGEIGETNTTISYELLLSSKHACAHAPHLTPASKSSTSLSGGTIFIIVLVSLIGAYLLFGVLFQGLIKGERGAKLCPNHAFWFSLPSLIKSGAKSITGQSRQEKAAKYDSI